MEEHNGKERVEQARYLSIHYRKHQTGALACNSCSYKTRTAGQRQSNIRSVVTLNEVRQCVETNNAEHRDAEPTEEHGHEKKTPTTEESTNYNNNQHTDRNSATLCSSMPHEN